jgi:hypothetical protein
LAAGRQAKKSLVSQVACVLATIAITTSTPIKTVAPINFPVAIAK